MRSKPCPWGGRRNARSGCRCGEPEECRAALTEMSPPYARVMSRQHRCEPSSDDHHRVVANRVPRAGVVNARRPGHRPGRSEAESIDDAEHGASIIGAMVVQFDLATERASRSAGERGSCANRFLRNTSAHFCGRIWPRECARGRRDSPARTGLADSDTRHDQRWRERPRQGALGSGAGHDSGVVHAIVGAVTSARAPSGESAQSAASRS